MNKVEQEKVVELRKKHNQQLIRRMKEGDPLKSFDSFSSWFPPRPIIEKDSDAVKRLYGQKTEVMKSEKKVANGSSKVVSLGFKDKEPTVQPEAS